MGLVGLLAFEPTRQAWAPTRIERGFSKYRFLMGIICVSWVYMGALGVPLLLACWFLSIGETLKSISKTLKTLTLDPKVERRRQLRYRKELKARLEDQKP